MINLPNGTREDCKAMISMTLNQLDKGGGEI